MPSAPSDQSIVFMNGILAGLQKAAAASGSVAFLVHGTTEATNALLEYKGARSALHRRPQDPHREVAPLLADADVGPTSGAAMKPRTASRTA